MRRHLATSWPIEFSIWRRVDQPSGDEMTRAMSWPIIGLHSVVSYDMKIIINNRIKRSDYGVSIISKWALNNGPVLEFCGWVETQQFRVNIPIKHLLMAADIFYSEYLSCLFTMSEKSLKAWWVPYSNMITCLIQFSYNLCLWLCVVIIVIYVKTYM